MAAGGEGESQESAPSLNFLERIKKETNIPHIEGVS
jgi:hypothetical protein